MGNLRVCVSGRVVVAVCKLCLLLIFVWLCVFVIVVCCAVLLCFEFVLVWACIVVVFAE